MPTITRTQNRRTLIAPTSLAVVAAKSISALTRVGTTATATSTSHGLSVGDWVLIQGSNYPQYNGPKRVETVADANTFTFTIETDPGADSGGTITAAKMVVGSMWGDSGASPINGLTVVGALPTATAARVIARITNATAPTTAAKLGVWTSPSGAAGTWRRAGAEQAGSLVANDEATLIRDVPLGQYVLVGFYGVAGNAVVVDAVGLEETSFTSA